jgi:TrmH family RNA methyltransferase
MQLAVGYEEEILQWCKLHHIKIYSAALQTNSLYTQVDYTGGTAFVMGAEDKGLEEFWRKSSDLIIKIPMLGHNDSLNVSVSAAVLLYETIRQRS